MKDFRRFLPILEWAPRYGRDELTDDLIAAVIVTIMLIPQSLAYALLAGLPPEVGLYASMAPLLVYALFGTSMTLAVGPVAVASLMTASAAGQIAEQGTDAYLAAAVLLALISGLQLLAMGVFRLGFLANFLSHPVISGFITAAGLIIAAAQLRHILGVDARGHNLLEIIIALVRKAGETNSWTLAIGSGVTAFLFWARKGVKPLLKRRFGLSDRLAGAIARASPVAAVAVTVFLSWALDLEARGVAIVGTVPAALPSLTLPPFDPEFWKLLFVPALMIGIIGYVETISVAQTLAARRHQRVDPDQELIALGAANVGSALSGGYPVTGGFARSVVNFEAGARTPAAGAFTAVGMGIAALYLTPFLYYLPKATLAATIIVAVLSLVNLRAIGRTWRYSRADGAAMLATIGVTLAEGVELGILAGVGLSIALFLYRTSRPHVAIVGQVPGTEHFRNVRRHRVVTAPNVLMIRVDESLYFPNARFLEDFVLEHALADPRIRHVVLVASAVNDIDASALESLEAINHRLAAAEVKFHLAEVKGPVMDRLKRVHFLEELTGEVFLTAYDAFRTLAPATAESARNAERCETALPEPSRPRGWFRFG